MYRPTSLIYDPDCGLCTATAAWLARRVRPDRLRLVPLTEAPSDQDLADAVAGRPLIESLHAVRPDGSVVTGARAALAAGRLVPRWDFVAILLDHRPGHAILEPVYRLIARRRHRIGRLLGLPASCEVPRRA
jgi:predicted DCC family thiol-disulfide oxidoreductase YuxK